MAVKYGELTSIALASSGTKLSARLFAILVFSVLTGVSLLQFDGRSKIEAIFFMQFVNGLLPDIRKVHKFNIFALWMFCTKDSREKRFVYVKLSLHSELLTAKPLCLQNVSLCS